MIIPAPGKLFRCTRETSDERGRINLKRKLRGQREARTPQRHNVHNMYVCIDHYEELGKYSRLHAMGLFCINCLPDNYSTLVPTSRVVGKA